ncbi:hypothetical protein DPMN_053203 [Dreissena polymorpha]|uniref:Uncharacterized protein n=1 Tax=Dreissena polymorpha TaxID=45954 RepID=A0A9D4HRY5_DREPO|nr:hypothetical protein DPMN_053203 [Dreissena polymorpha]
MIGQKLKTAPPTGGHDLQRTGTTFELNHIFELDQDITGTNLLTKFHEDRTINAASRVFTNKCGRTTDGRRTKTGHKSPPEQPGELISTQSHLYGDLSDVIRTTFDTNKIGERLFTKEAITVFRVLSLKVAGYTVGLNE